MYYQGDCFQVMVRMPSNSIDLIVTSPPYANARKNTYGGILHDNYVDWFLTRSLEMKRILKLSGTFILNIKENVVNGERHTYVLELILALRRQGWFWTEEFIWHKSTSVPGKWPNRFRDGWERLLQFNKSKKFNMYQDAVRIPRSKATEERSNRLQSKDYTRRESVTGSGFGVNISNVTNRELVYPDNVLYLSPVTHNKGHSAVFPESIPEWFIKLFTVEDDIVLDPFAGSGTTVEVAERMGRIGIGIDINEIKPIRDLT